MENTAQFAEWFQALCLIIAGIWTVIKTTDWYKGRKDSRLMRALDILYGKVQETYSDPGGVREQKRASADGKLTLEQANTAMEKTIRMAKVEAKEAGIKLEKVIGNDGQIRAKIEERISSMKNRMAARRAGRI